MESYFYNHSMEDSQLN